MVEERPKVGIISCSGEDLCEGTISRLATRRVLETLRPHQTVTICLPLFLAGNEGERGFARDHPTITVDGCSKLCARQGTEAHSGPVSAGLVVSDLLDGRISLSGARSTRKLSDADLAAVDLVTERIAELVDEVAGAASSGPQPWDEGEGAGCACGRSLPVGEVFVGGRAVRIAGLPLIFERLAEAGLKPEESAGPQLLETVKIYNPIAPAEEPSLQAALVEAYCAYYGGRQ